MSEEKKIYKAISDAMADIDAIGKNKKNQQQGFMFRGIDDAYNQLHPVMVKHRIFSVPEVIADRHEERTTKSGGNLIYRILTIRYTFYADDGSSIAVVVIGEGMDSGDKAASKAMAIAHKYALIQLFCVPTEDLIDPDSETQPESVPAVDMERIREGKNTIHKMLDDNKDILEPEYISAKKRDAGNVKSIEDITKVYREVKKDIDSIRKRETKAATDDGFSERAAEVLKGEVIGTKPIPESLAKALKEKDAGEGFKDDSAELEKSVKSN